MYIPTYKQIYRARERERNKVSSLDTTYMYFPHESTPPLQKTRNKITQDLHTKS